MKSAGNEQKIEVFIIDNDPSVVTSLRNYLQIRFGKLLHISTFNTGLAAVSSVCETTDIVVLENYLTGENGGDIRHSIREKNHKTQVVRLGTRREIGDAIEIYNNGVQREPRLQRRTNGVMAPVYRVIGYPAGFISKELRVNEFIGILIAGFLFMGIVVSLVIAFAV